MIAKYPGTCICKSPVKIGDIIAYDHVSRRVVSCPRCDGADRVTFDKAPIKCGDLSAFVARKDGVIRAVKFSDGLDSSIFVLRSEGWTWRCGMMASRELAAMVAATAAANLSEVILPTYAAPVIEGEFCADVAPLLALGFEVDGEIIGHMIAEDQAGVSTPCKGSLSEIKARIAAKLVKRPATSEVQALLSALA
jgi:hypothetical protein